MRVDRGRPSPARWATSPARRRISLPVVGRRRPTSSTGRQTSLGGGRVWAWTRLATVRGRIVAALTVAVVVTGVGALGGVAACGRHPAERQLRLMYAGSLIVPFDRLAAAYEVDHPDVDVVTESHGSIQVMRHVSELGDVVDVAVTADEQLIPPMLYDTRRSADG